MTRGRRRFLAGLALAGVAAEARSLVCFARPPWPQELLADASAILLGWVVDVEDAPPDRLAFTIGRVMVERCFRGELAGQVRLVLPASAEPGQRLLVFAHPLSDGERIRLVTRRLDQQHYQHVACHVQREGSCSEGLPRPDFDFPALGAIELRNCYEWPVSKLVPGSRDPREQEELLIPQLEAALGRAPAPR